jgi:hypothetical protein
MNHSYEGSSCAAGGSSPTERSEATAQTCGDFCASKKTHTEGSLLRFPQALRLPLALRGLWRGLRIWVSSF